MVLTCLLDRNHVWLEDSFYLDISPLSSAVRAELASGCHLSADLRPLTTRNSHRLWGNSGKVVEKLPECEAPQGFISLHFLRSQSDVSWAGDGSAAHLRASRGKTDAARPSPLPGFVWQSLKQTSLCLSCSILIFCFVAVCCSTNSNNRRLQSFSSCFHHFVKTNDVWIGSLNASAPLTQRRSSIYSTKDACERCALQKGEYRWENEEEQHDEALVLTRL